jgi:hypothetical protein
LILNIIQLLYRDLFRDIKYYVGVDEYKKNKMQIGEEIPGKPAILPNCRYVAITLTYQNGGGRS